MVQFFFFVVINWFSIYKDFRFATCLDGDLFRIFIFDFTVFRLDTKRKQMAGTSINNSFKSW